MIDCGLGEGMEPALQGLLTFLTDSTRNSQLFTTVAAADTLGELVGGPLTGALVNVGRRPGHPSDGLCFLGSSVGAPLILVSYHTFGADSITHHLCNACYLRMLYES